MNQALRKMINGHRAEVEHVFAQEVVETSEQALDDYVAGLDPDNPFNYYSEAFVVKIKRIMRGEVPAIADDLASNIANGQLKKQLEIKLGIAPEQTGKRGPA